MSLNEIRRMQQATRESRLARAQTAQTSRSTTQALNLEITGTDSATGLATATTDQGAKITVAQRSSQAGQIAQVTRSPNSPRAILPAASGGSSSTPTAPTAFPVGITQIALTLPNLFSLAGSPVTAEQGSGTFAATLAAQSPNFGFFGPTSGGAGVPSFRALENADIPTAISPSKVGNSIAQWNAAQLQGRDVSTTAPANLQILTYDSLLGVWKPANPAFNPTIETATITTASLANGASENLTVSIAKTFTFVGQITTNVPARIRLYTTVVNRNSDLARAIGTAPLDPSPILLELITSAGRLTYDLNGVGSTSENSALIAYSVTNLSGSNSAVITTLNYIKGVA